MRICESCGVELDDTYIICPLCGGRERETERQGDGEEKRPGDEETDRRGNGGVYPSDVIRMQRDESRQHLWELGGIVAFSCLAICLIVDLLLNGRPEWSLISGAAVLAAWLIVTLFVKFKKKPIVVISGLMASTLGLLLVICLNTEGEWFIPVALPVTVAASLTTGAIVMFMRSAHFTGFNLLAAALLIISAFCIVTELALDNYLFGDVRLRWSLIAAVSALPFELIFIFYHYRLRKGKRLDSFFHV